MQIKRLLWTLLVETVAWLLIWGLARYLDIENLLSGGGGLSRSESHWSMLIDFQAVLLLALLIAWLTTIYKNLSAPKG